MNASLPQEFPTYALPPLVRDAVWEAQRNTQAPLGLIASSALTAMSLAMQGLANVRRMDGLEGPTSLWFLTVAESGERKSALDLKFLSAIREFERKQTERFDKEMNEYEASMAAWKVEEKTILSAIKKGFERTTDEIAQLRKQLQGLYANRPKKPRSGRMTFENTTPSAMLRTMNSTGPSVGLISDEGASILNGRMMSDLPLLNTMWGGGLLTYDRVDEHVSIRDPRLTLSLQIQPIPLTRVFKKRGDELHGIGLLGRFVFSYPETTQGNRIILNPAMSWEHLQKFEARILELLEMNIGSNGEPPEKIMLAFSPEAQARWINAYNLIEEDLKPGRYYAGVKEYAAKLADNLARMAAHFHLLQGRNGDISLETLEQAISVMFWYSEEFVRWFSPSHPIPQDQIDATAMEKFIAEQIMRANCVVNIKRNYIQQYGPNQVREKSRLMLVFDFLIAYGKISIQRIGKTTWIVPNPTYFTPQQVQYLCAASPSRK